MVAGVWRNGLWVAYKLGFAPCCAKGIGTVGSLGLQCSSQKLHQVGEKSNQPVLAVPASRPITRFGRSYHTRYAGNMPTKDNPSTRKEHERRKKTHQRSAVQCNML